jgi:elongation factor G
MAKEFSTEQVRNVSLVGHGSCGKTSLAEAMLFSAGVTSRLGSVEEGNTVSDYNSEEVKRKISISLSVLHLERDGTKINLLDLPGYADFVGESLAGTKVSETAIVIVSAIAGIEVGTEQFWKLAVNSGCSRLFFINKLDKEHAKFYEHLQSLQRRFSNSVVALQIPMGEGLDFKGLIDLVSMKAFVFQKGAKPKEEDIPAEFKEEAERYRNSLSEAVSEADDELLEKFLEAGQLTTEEIKQGLRKGFAEGKVFPVVCGAATANWGASDLLDCLIEYGPSPAAVKEITGFDPDRGQEQHRKISPHEPAVAYVFKTVSEPHVGELSFFRSYCGTITSGLDLFNPGRQVSERIGQIHVMNGKERKEIGRISAGDIGAFVKLKNTHTGDTLCEKRNPFQLPAIKFPKPVIGMAIKPLHKGDEEKIASGFSKLHEEDPTFIMEVNADTKQTLIYGQGELHLEIMVSKLQEKFGVGVQLEDPKIPYRETVKKGKTEIQGKYKRQSGGRGQYGDAWLRLEPLPRGEGFQFADEIFGGAIPGKYVPSVEEGVKEAMQEGVLAGFPVVDVKVTLYDGSYHTVDSSDMAFKIAASMGFKKGAAEAKPVLLEPIYELEVLVPEEFMGAVMGDISSRRGKIMGMEADGTFQKIRAKVPLAEMNKYSTSLRSLTQGRGFHSRSFSHYEEIPHEISEKIVKQALEAKEKEKQG